MFVSLACHGVGGAYLWVRTGLRANNRSVNCCFRLQTARADDIVEVKLPDLNASNALECNLIVKSWPSSFLVAELASLWGSSPGSRLLALIATSAPPHDHFAAAVFFCRYYEANCT